MKKINDIKLNEEFQIYVALKSIELRTAKQGNTYASCVFQDSSGFIEGKIWHIKEELMNQLEPGTILYLEGKKELYHDQVQVKIKQIRRAHEEEVPKGVSYTPKAPVSVDKLQDICISFIEQIKNPILHDIVSYLYTTYEQEFLSFPAAKTLHHAFEGGLIYHTVSMLQLAKAIEGHYPEVNQELLYSGIILHDLGKIFELSGPDDTVYTLSGNLVGHIVLVDEAIQEACYQLEIHPQEESVILLKHMILAHHGKLEYGSPVKPQLLEAEILHQLDYMDASITMITKALEKTEPGTFSPRLFGLDNRRFYHPNHKGDHKDESKK